MKFLTVCQPYAEMLARGAAVKPAENRRWSTSYRGLLAIHAGRSRSWLQSEDIATFPDMVFGAVVCVGRLVACLDYERPGEWPERYADVREHQETNGPFCLVLEDVRRLERPVFCCGAQGLWVPRPDERHVLREIESQIAMVA